MRTFPLALLCTLALLAGCSKSHKHDRSAKPPAAPTAGATAPTAGAPVKGHEHHAPHKGTLVALGEEYAHLELVLDPATGTLQAYVLDGEAEKAVRVAQKEIELKFMVNKPSQSAVEEGKRVNNTVTLLAQADALTGEKEGDTSYFMVKADTLKDANNFDGVLTLVNVKGKEFKDVKFNFPKGNE